MVFQKCRFFLLKTFSTPWKVFAPFLHPTPSLPPSLPSLPPSSPSPIPLCYLYYLVLLLFTDFPPWDLTFLLCQTPGHYMFVNFIFDFVNFFMYLEKPIQCLPIKCWCPIKCRYWQIPSILSELRSHRGLESILRKCHIDACSATVLEILTMIALYNNMHLIHSDYLLIMSVS